VDWSRLPDVAVVSVLALAFFSAARKSRISSSRVWLVGWVMIVVHFATFLFVTMGGAVGLVSVVLGPSALAGAGILFMWAAVPYRNQASSRWMLAAFLTANTIYIVVVSLAPAGHWVVVPAVVLVGVLPLAVSLGSIRTFRHPLRWSIALLYCALSAFLLVARHRPGGAHLGIDAVLFSVYLGCCINFWYAYRRATAGALITILGFFLWAIVFPAAPAMLALFPSVHLENEVWNLPEYVVAVGMILLLLEDQIEHNKFLALHDELTGLPNRRLYQDRLENALERARRTGSQAALLLIDLDRFKEVNDTMGHHVGDELLKHVSKLFLGRMRRTDTVARTGGDEFSVILEEPVSRSDAKRVAQTLTQLLKEPVDLEGNTIHIGASVGIAVFPEDAGDAEALSIAADLRMYANKRAARSLEEHGAPVGMDPLQPVEPASKLQCAE
jgi:diguanylate cyclase (GGDEF)-like protein